MSDYVALIGILALMFAPLYIPIAVTIIGGIRGRREAVAARRPVVPQREVLRSAHGVERASANTRPTATVAPRGGQGALASTRPVAERVSA
jgi:hypothetical protein